MPERAPLASAAWNAVADATAIGDGTALLDVGCGTGGFCRLAAARGAVVHGIDTDADRIAAARRAIPGGDFRVANLEELPWPDGTFDVVTGFNVFQYAGEVERGLAEARRVTRGSGRVGVCKWGPPSTNEFFAFLGLVDPSRLALVRPPGVDPVDAALERLGVACVAAGEVPAVITFDTDRALTTALASAGACEGSDDRAAWHTRVLAAASSFRQADGGYRFENRLMYRVFAV